MIQKVVGGAHFEARDGFLVCLRQGGVDPGDDGVISHLLAIAQFLQDVEGVPKEENRRWSAPLRSSLTHTHTHIVNAPITFS